MSVSWVLRRDLTLARKGLENLETLTQKQRFAKTRACSRTTAFRIATPTGAKGLFPPDLAQDSSFIGREPVLDRPSLWKSAQTIDRIWNRNHKYGHKVAEALRTHPTARERNYESTGPTGCG
jgi:hypothetical protein